MMIEFLSIFFLVVGTLFIIISALGVVRMPDLYIRMSSSTKSSTLGVGLVMLSSAIHYHEEIGVASRSVAIIVFLILTAPVAAHLIGRAAYFAGVPLWNATRYDELKGHYNHYTHTLVADAPPAQPDNSREVSPLQ